MALVLGLAAPALMAHLRDTVVQNAQSTAEVRASDAAALLRSGELPHDWYLPDDKTAFVQVVQGATVISGSSNAGTRPVAGGGTGWNTVRGLSVDPDAQFRVIDRPVHAHGQRYVVVAGSSMDETNDALAATRLALTVAVPGVVLLVGLLTWIAAGRALRPVDVLRAEVDDISSRGLHRRVNEPAGAEEITRLAHTMNDMLGRVEEAVDRQRNFVADASHELRNPLAALRAELEIALAQPHIARWPRVVTNALGDTRRLERLAHDLLLLARLDTPDSPHKDTVDLAALVVEAVRDHPMSVHHTIGLTSTASATVVGHPTHLRRLVDNLLDNADRYAAHSVSIDVGCVGDVVTLSVADDGIGVSDDDADRIFERFVRLDDARSRQSGGSGLGLAIARDIATAHNGTLIVVPGRTASGPSGAMFTLNVPAQSGTGKTVSDGERPVRG